MKSKTEGTLPINQQKQPIPGRNDLCSCGSGKKYKKCCALLQLPPRTVAPSAPIGPAVLTPGTPAPALIWRSAVQAFQAGDLKRAQQECDRLLKLDPANSEALHLRSLIAYRSQDHPAGLRYVQRAIQLAPRTALFHNTLGIISQA